MTDRSKSTAQAPEPEEQHRRTWVLDIVFCVFFLFFALTQYFYGAWTISPRQEFFLSLAPYLVATLYGAYLLAKWVFSIQIRLLTLFCLMTLSAMYLSSVSTLFGQSLGGRLEPLIATFFVSTYLAWIGAAGLAYGFYSFLLKLPGWRDVRDEVEFSTKPRFDVRMQIALGTIASLLATLLGLLTPVDYHLWAVPLLVFALFLHREIYTRQIITFHANGVGITGRKRNYLDTEFRLANDDQGVHVVAMKKGAPPPRNLTWWPIVPPNQVDDVRRILDEKQGGNH